MVEWILTVNFHRFSIDFQGSNPYSAHSVFHPGRLWLLSSCLLRKSTHASHRPLWRPGYVITIKSVLHAITRVLSEESRLLTVPQARRWWNCIAPNVWTLHSQFLIVPQARRWWNCIAPNVWTFTLPSLRVITTPTAPTLEPDSPTCSSWSTQNTGLLWRRNNNASFLIGRGSCIVGENGVVEPRGGCGSGVNYGPHLWRLRNVYNKLLYEKWPHQERRKRWRIDAHTISYICVDAWCKKVEWMKS